jgi:hypothetical protein
VRKSSSSSTGTLYWYMTPGIVGESDLSGKPDRRIYFLWRRAGCPQEHEWRFLLFLRSPQNRLGDY